MKWVICGITGFMETPVNPESGIHQILDAVSSEPNIVRVAGFGWRFYDSGLKYLVSNTSEETKVILVGHSWGAHAAIQLTKDFNKKTNRLIDYLFTIDAIHHTFGFLGFGFWPRACKESALLFTGSHHFNFYQTDTFLVHGNIIPSAETNIKVENTSHAGIDNAEVPVIANEIKERIIEGIKSLSKL